MVFHTPLPDLPQTPQKEPADFFEREQDQEYQPPDQIPDGKYDDFGKQHHEFSERQPIEQKARPRTKDRKRADHTVVPFKKQQDQRDCRRNAEQKIPKKEEHPTGVSFSGRLPLRVISR